MNNYKSEFLNVVKERGFLHQCTDLNGLDTLLAQETKTTAYIGFDCTAPSLHVGSLMQIMILLVNKSCNKCLIVGHVLQINLKCDKMDL